MRRCSGSTRALGRPRPIPDELGIWFAKCAELLAQRTADEILITQAGKPLARVLPIVEDAADSKPLPNGNDTPPPRPTFHVARSGDAMSREE